MNLQRNWLFSFIEKTLPLLVSLVMLFYTYAKFFGHPYGFRWRSSTGIVIYVFDKQPEPTLKEGDRIIQIGNVSWEEFSKDLRKTFFVGAKPGDVVPIVVERDGQTLDIPWKLSGFNREEFFDQFYSEWAIAYFFWLAGTLTILFVRPKNDRWLLMGLFNFLTAIWLIAGSGVSTFHIWNSALVLRIAVILCVPVYLHFHWVFPQPLGKISPILLISIYAVTLALVIAQWFQILPSSFFLLGFTVALGGSFILLLIHILRQTSARRDLQLLFVVTLLAMVLALIWQIVYNFNKIPSWLGSGGLLGLPLLPLTYLYSAFRRRLGGLELRVNRFFSTYLFIILLGIVELPLIALLAQAMQISGQVAAISLLSAVLTAAAFIWAYPAFENFVERRIFGIPIPSKRVLETYSVRITTSVSSSDLVHVLQREILPSLLVRQFVFLQHDRGLLKVISTMAVNEEQIPKESDLPNLMAQSGVYRSPDLITSDQPYSWIRLNLPLKLGEETIGFWLFGRRDPDDLYSQQEIPTLSSLANLTAIALSNILQTERLKAMYEVNIDRYEQERLRLAHDLHDSILNEMASMIISSDVSVFSPAFQQAFDELTERLREIVNDLRPPSLNFGLKFAFEDMADKLSERTQGAVKILSDIQSDGEWRYPEKVEIHLYRIVQEASENSLRYAHAKKIVLFGRLSQTEFEIKVQDDGIGLNPEISLKLNDLLANKHFGLANMHERASLIGAEINIDSKPNEGTRIHVVWRTDQALKV